MKKEALKKTIKFPSLLTMSRGKWELLAFLVIVVFGLTVITVSFSSQATLTYDATGGKISYTGRVVNHRMNGKGKLTYPNGDIYAGHFANGVFSGQGTFKAKSGWSYTGQFKDGKPDGEGILTARNGKIYKGTFKQGIYQK